jgi:hypothetical protein
MTWLDRPYEYRDKGLNIIAADPLFERLPCRSAIHGSPFETSFSCY